jgi:hypothetical protein
MTSTEPWSLVVKCWRKAGVHVGPGASLESIDLFQKKYGVVLPTDLLEYLLFVDGTGAEFSDDFVTSFHCLADFIPVHDYLNDSRGVVYPGRYAYPHCFVFANHMIDSWLYAVEITTDPMQPAPVFRVMDSEVQSKALAGSFREFMTNYANDPGSIL